VVVDDPYGTAGALRRAYLAYRVSGGAAGTDHRPQLAERVRIPGVRRHCAGEVAARSYGVGELAGIPLAVKDNIDTRDAPTTAGTAALQGRVPRADNTAVARVRAASGLLAGKTVMHELSLGITSNNAVTGPARNPYDPSLIAGGSSGGTATAVAAGMVPAGLGADTGGSVRQPASLCGLVGFRPTVGRYPPGGAVPLSRTRDTIGPMARSVADVVLLDAVLAGAPAASGPVPLRGIRIGVPENPFYRDLDAEVDVIARRTLERLAVSGAELVPVDLSETAERADGAGTPIVLHELARDLPGYLDGQGYELSFDDVRHGVRSPDVRELLGDGAEAEIDAELYRMAMVEREHARHEYQELLARHDLRALLQPTCPLPARPIGQDTTVELNGRSVPTFGAYVRHANLAGVLGLPAISVPAGHTVTGLPVGFEINSSPGDDDTVLGLAASVEAVLAA